MGTNDEEHTLPIEKTGKKEIRVERLSVFLIVFETIFVIISIICSGVTATKYNSIDHLNKEYIQMQHDVAEIGDASDYLTARCRQYVMTGEGQYAFDYFEEINVAKRRENALASVHVAVSDVGIQTNHYLDQALEESNKLAETELRAMALVYLAQGTDGNIPEEILGYELSKEEQEMTSDQKEYLAGKLVFSMDYSKHKETITKLVEDASKDILDKTRTYVDVCSREYHTASITLKVMLAACAVLFVIIVVALFTLILIPIKKSIASIEKEELIEYGRGYELNYLARAFNHLHSNNIREKLRLKYTAERDGLTKLLNRNGYEEITKYLTGKDEPIALIIIDADKFKDVNDGFGHEAGDIALKRIADLLLECFRNEDYVFRYGGDEFLVIMTDINIQKKNVIAGKLRHLNEVLISENKPGGPQLTLSMGAAFSENGFSQELFKQADKALYKTKENGRCGFNFY